MAAAAKRRMAAVVVALLLTAASPAAAVAPPIMPAPLAADAAGTPGGSRPSGTLPAGVHLSLGDSEDSVVVMWSTAQQPDAACVQLYAADAGAQPGSATARRLQHLQAGQPGVAQPLQLPQPAPQVQTVCGSSTPFVEPSTERVSQHLSTVVLAGLAPGLRYRYRCGSDAGGWTDWRAFRAKRSAAQFSEQAPAQLLIVGDMGAANARAWPALAADAGSGGFDALLHIGDLAYDLAQLQGRRAAQFLALVEPAAAGLPYLVAPGNHEHAWNLSHYRALFAMPQRAASEGLFYSFDLGPLHVLVYNSEAFFWPELFGEAEQARMFDWMAADLAAVDRRRTPWVLAAGHRPMYCAALHGGSGGCSEEAEAARRGIPSTCPNNNPAACRPLRPEGGGPTFPIEELFHRHGVDLAVAGHVHCYTRYWPVFNRTAFPPGESAGGGPGSGSGSSSGGGPSSSSSSSGPIVYEDPRATVHVTSGAGGNPEMRSGPQPPPAGPCAAPWCAFASGFAPGPGQSYDFSHSRLVVLNATHLRWQQYSSTLGAVVDEWWLVQRRHGPFGAPLSA